MNKPVSMEFNIRFKKCGRESKREIREGAEGAVPQIPTGRLPRISRCMGLAIHLEEPIRACALEEYPVQSDQTERFNPFQSIDDGLCT